MERRSVEARDLREVLGKVVEHFGISLYLIFGSVGVDIGEVGVAEGEEFACGIELHGARAERNHRVCERNILAVEAFDITH